MPDCKPVDFVCFGMLKAGTTMLQRMLNLHPQVSCPSQISVELIQEQLEKLATACNEKMVSHDERTGGQGATLIAEATVQALCRDAVNRIARDAGAGKTVCGLKDNRLIRRPELIPDLFPNAKLIVIFRHPVDQAVSAWHYNHRVAERSDDPSTLQGMLQHGDQDDWIILLSRLFEFLTTNLLEVCEGREVLMVRYEDLVADRLKGLKEIFTFLGVRYGQATLKPIAEASSFERMRDSSKDHTFFHRGTPGYEVSEAINTRAEEIAGKAMRRVGYRV